MRAKGAAMAMVVVALAAPYAHAQTALPRRPGPTLPTAPRPAPPPTVSPKVEDPKDLRARFGIDLAQRLERSNDPDERLRALARASALGTPDAIAMLVAALDPTAPTRSDARAKIEVARGLAGHVDVAAARAALMSILNVGNPSAGGRNAGGAIRASADPFSRRTPCIDGW